MVSMRNTALVASFIISLATAAPAVSERQAFTPGKLNNAREFHIKMTVTDGDRKYNGYSRKPTPSHPILTFSPSSFPNNPKVQTTHSGAGIADPTAPNCNSTNRPSPSLLTPSQPTRTTRVGNPLPSLPVTVQVLGLTMDPMGFRLIRRNMMDGLCVNGFMELTSRS